MALGSWAAGARRHFGGRRLRLQPSLISCKGKTAASLRLNGEDMEGLDFRNFWPMFEDRYKIEAFPRGHHVHQP
jgi:hypothetical protein